PCASSRKRGTDRGPRGGWLHRRATRGRRGGRATTPGGGAHRVGTGRGSAETLPDGPPGRGGARRTRLTPQRRFRAPHPAPTSHRGGWSLSCTEDGRAKGGGTGWYLPARWYPRPRVG